MLIELKNIEKRFVVRSGTFGGQPSVVRAVDNVDLMIRAGENLGLVGESGCGKTTLGRVMMRLLTPDAGRIIFQGTDISRLSGKKLRPYRKDIQMVFQDPFNSLDPRFTIRNVLKEAMIFSPVNDRMKCEEKMRDVLASVGLRADALSRFPHEFSGGERQRIAIARALIINPKLLILDEAVSSLDVLIQQQILDLLRDLQSQFKLTYLFISHNLRVVRKVSQRIAVMYRGKIVESAPSDELFNNPVHPYTKELLAAAIDYRSSGRKSGFDLREGARLTDRGGRHFVAE